MSRCKARYYFNQFLACKDVRHLLQGNMFLFGKICTPVTMEQDLDLWIWTVDSWRHCLPESSWFKYSVRQPIPLRFIRQEIGTSRLWHQVIAIGISATTPTTDVVLSWVELQFWSGWIGIVANRWVMNKVWELNIPSLFRWEGMHSSATWEKMPTYQWMPSGINIDDPIED